MRVVILLIFSVSSANIDCADVNCTSCTTGYLYKGISCLPLCPFGFSSLSVLNRCNGTGQNLFYIEFFAFTEYTSRSIEVFYHPYNLSFQDQSQKSPIPTIDRGFYFANTSSLVSASN